MSETETTYSVFINDNHSGCEDQPLEVALAVFQGAAAGGHLTRMYTNNGKMIASCPAARAVRQSGGL